MAFLTAQERLGTKLAGKYELVRVLGEGGMGVVFEGFDARFDRKVAVKFLHPQYASAPEVVRRFFNEAKAAASLPGEHIVQVFDFDVDPSDGAAYLVLEFLDGEPLSSMLERKGPLAPELAFGILGPVMRMLTHAHTRGIVHRDLKPDNIYLARNWEGVVVPKVLDFGIAKLMEGERSGGAHTATGLMLGTPAYVAPEQAEGKDVGPWCDVWSMGVIWCEALTGRLHHDFAADESPTSVVVKVITKDPRRLAELAPHLPVALTAAIDGALVRDRNQRHGSMRTFHDAVGKALDIAPRDASSVALAATQLLAPSPPSPVSPRAVALASAPGVRPTYLWLSIGLALVGILTVLGLGAAGTWLAVSAARPHTEEPSSATVVSTPSPTTPSVPSVPVTPTESDVPPEPTATPDAAVVSAHSAEPASAVPESHSDSAPEERGPRPARGDRRVTSSSDEAADPVRSTPSVPTPAIEAPPTAAPANNPNVF